MSYQTSTSYRQINGGSDANSRQLTMTANSSELSYIYIYFRSENRAMSKYKANRKATRRLNRANGKG